MDLRHVSVSICAHAHAQATEKTARNAEITLDGRSIHAVTVMVNHIQSEIAVGHHTTL